MVIAVAYVHIETQDCFSLKEKRSVVKSIKERLAQRFNLSVAEVDYLDDWHQSLLGIALVSNEQKHANSMLTQVMNYIEKTYPHRMSDFQMDFIHYGFD